MEEKLKSMQKKGSNDLSDIILEKSAKKTEKTKKIMLLLASLVLFFLIVLIIVKMLNKDTTPESTIATQPTQITPIESTTQTTQESEDALFSASENENKENEQLFTKEPIIEQDSETDLKFEEMVRKLKEQDEQQSTTTTNVAKTEEPTKIEEEPSAISEPAIRQSEPIVTQTQPISTPEIVEPTVIPTQKTTPIQERVIVESKEFVKPIEYKKSHKKEWKPLAKKPISYPQARTKPKHNNISSSFDTPSGYFVQVGATSRAFPDQNFLNKVRNSGYDYIIHNVVIKGRTIKKILVGPYKNRASASNALGNIKTRINPSAYIYRIK